MKNNLFTKISLLIISIIFIVFSIYTFINIKSEREASLKLMKIYASISVSNFVKDNIYYAVDNNQASLIINAVDILKENKSIKYIILYLKSGENLFIQNDSWKILKNIDKSYKKFEDLKKEKYGIIKGVYFKNEVFHYSLPMNISEKNLGWVHFGFSLDVYEKNLHIQLQNLLIISIFAFILTILITFIFVKRLIKPIVELSEGTKKIISGEYDNLEYKNKYFYEVDILRENFNTMTNFIKDSRHKLLLSNSLLEKKVKQRTKELDLLNKNLDKKIKEEIKKNRLQEQMLFEQTKMTQMQELLLSISHHWRQPLSAISTVITTMNLKNELNNIIDEDFNKNYTLVMKNIGYLSDTIEVFSTYLESSNKIEKFELNKTIEEIFILNKELTNEMFIDIEFEKKEDIYIHSNKSNLMQAILNILRNSVDAFGNKKDDKKIKISLELNTNNVDIIILDNAGGISENIINKIFEPYFTTKDTFQGKGMGLYLTYNIIVNKLNGNIIAKNIENGVSFKISLPLYST